MTLEDRTHLRLMRDTLNPHNIRVTFREGQYILSFVDEIAGLISWKALGDMLAYKLGLDMRDHRKAYVQAKQRRNLTLAHGQQPTPVTSFFQSNINRIELGVA